MSEKEKGVLIRTTAPCYGTFNCTKEREALYQEPCKCPAGQECLKTWLKGLFDNTPFHYEELYAFLMKKYFREDTYAEKKRVKD